MSYILDALKKSEQQRASLNIPVGTPPLARQPASGMSRLRLSLVILLVALTAGWFIAQLQKPDNHQPTPVIPTQMTSEQTASDQGITKHVTSKQSTPGQIASVPAVASTPIAAPATPVRQPRPTQTGKRTHTVSSTAAKQGLQNNVQPEEADVSANNKPEHAPVGHAESHAVSADSVPVFKPITPTSPVSRGLTRFPDTDNDISQGAPVNSGISSISELPVSVQHSLPSINIEGHIYDDNPAARMVIVNGKIRREKQTIGNGLRLEEITSDGVILSYQGNIFHMGVFER